MRRWLPLLLLSLLAGCRTTADPPRPTTTLLPDTTTAQRTSTTDAIWARPAVVDLPYVQRLLETIYHLDGEATRHAYAKKAADTELDLRFRAIFGGPALDEARTVLAENAAQGFVAFANPPKDAAVRAAEVVQATPNCMVIRADLDFGPQYVNTRPPPPRAVIQMRPADVLPFNPTGWGVVFNGQPDVGKSIRVC